MACYPGKTRGNTKKEFSFFLVLPFYIGKLERKRGKKMIRFPKDFLWGGATACFQYEGGYKEKEEAYRVMILKLLVT